jgi:hypothetical protein
MKKKCEGKNIQINMSNRSFYSLITLGIFILLGAGILVVDAVQQASSGGGTHNWAEVGIPSCSNGQVLKFDGGTWDCGTDAEGSATTTLPWASITGIPAGFSDGVDNDVDTNTDYCSGGSCDGSINFGDTNGWIGVVNWGDYSTTNPALHIGGLAGGDSKRRIALYADTKVHGDLAISGNYIIGTGDALHIKATGSRKDIYLNPHTDTGNVYVGGGGGAHNLIIDNGNLNVGGYLKVGGVVAVGDCSESEWGIIQRCIENGISHKMCACSYTPYSGWRWAPLS